MGKGIFQQQKNGLYAVNIVAQSGVLTPEQLLLVAEAARDTGVWRFKFSTRQTMLAVLAQEQLADFTDRITSIGLKLAPFGNLVRNVKACAGGEGLCPRALSDAVALGTALQEKYLGQPTPKDFKMAAAGCSRGCTDPYCADMGFIGTGGNRFDIIIGGRGATVRPTHGRLLVPNVPREKVIPVVDYVLEQYRTYGQPSERFCKTIDRLGLDQFKPPADIYTLETDQPDEFAEFLFS